VEAAFSYGDALWWTAMLARPWGLILAHPMSDGGGRILASLLAMAALRWSATSPTFARLFRPVLEQMNEERDGKAKAACCERDHCALARRDAYGVDNG
jgi:hypothetical protein